jgi:hypothetical protein
VDVGGVDSVLVVVGVESWRGGMGLLDICIAHFSFDTA